MSMPADVEQIPEDLLTSGYSVSVTVVRVSTAGMGEDRSGHGEDRLGYGFVGRALSRQSFAAWSVRVSA